MSVGFKHLIRCRCVLPQFRSQQDPPFHHFVVFSVMDDSEAVQPKIVQCNNCGILHKVTDLCRSEFILDKESSTTLVTLADVKSTLSAGLVGALEVADVDLATWEAVKFVVDNKRWGEHVVLSVESTSGTRQGKYVRILSESLFKIEVFSREEFATLE